MKISNEAVQATYEVAKRVHERAQSKADGIDELHRKFAMNRGSAGGYINDIECLLQGKRNTRTINEYATEHFLEKTHRDFGLASLKNTISAVNKHLDYYENHPKGKKLPGVHKIVERYIVISEKSEQQLFARKQDELQKAGEFDPTDDADGRERTIAAIVRRQGQPAFRRRMLSLYQTRCAISDCGVEAALEAAHILPYRGRKTNYPTNGLLLRGDLHTLFDLGLIAVDVERMAVVIAPELKGTCYEELAGKKLKVPENAPDSPNHEALNEHRTKRSKT